jgi:hypothetical protein
MKLLIAAGLLSMAAGYASAQSTPNSGDCSSYPGCSLAQASQSSGGADPSSGYSTGYSGTTQRSESGVKQSPYWAGCYFYPGCTAPEPQTIAQPNYSSSATSSSGSSSSGSSSGQPSSKPSESAIKQSPYWAGCYFYPGC